MTDNAASDVVEAIVGLERAAVAVGELGTEAGTAMARMLTTHAALLYEEQRALDAMFQSGRRAPSSRWQA